MPSFCQLNADTNQLVELLELHFDPDRELARQAKEIALAGEADIVPVLTDADAEYLEKIREEKH